MKSAVHSEPAVRIDICTVCIPDRISGGSDQLGMDGLVGMKESAVSAKVTMRSILLETHGPVL